MATIELSGLNHSYGSKDADGEGFAIEDLNCTWENGSANALLGPSGCGKTTLLNVLSGLLKPNGGRILFDGVDVSDLSTKDRHIAQIFQFPVVYDTMTVFDNLAFPLRNRRHTGQKEIAGRVGEIAELLDLARVLNRSAGELNPAEKQVVSLGRGIVRKDTAAVLLDEPLTVIDPVLKLDLRRKLRLVQRELNITMIYVTHDQHEALTFADSVTIMNQGEIVQTATPEGLFQEPQTPFVGYFIGSPGMNMMACDREGIVGSQIRLSKTLQKRLPERGGLVELGIRPEFVEVSDERKEDWSAMTVESADHAGAFQILTLASGEVRLKAKVDDMFSAEISESVWVRFPDDKVKLYVNGELRA